MKNNNFARRHEAMIKRSIGKTYAQFKYEVITDYEEYLN